MNDVNRARNSRVMYYLNYKRQISTYFHVHEAMKTGRFHGDFLDIEVPNPVTC